jgi:hypothetical protein
LQFTAGRHVPGVFWFQFEWSVVKESGAWNKNRNSKSKKKKKKQTNEDMRLALETTTNGEKKIVWGILFLFSIVSFFTSTH